MKKILAFILALIISISLVGCESQMTLRIACDKELIEADYLLRAVEYYQTHSNTVVEIVEYSSAALTDPTVDVIIHPVDADIIDIGMEKLFYDFSGEMWVNDIRSYCYDSVMYDSHVYGYPFGTSNITGCYYNKKKFEELGLSVPKNQTEFEAVCDTLVAAGIIPISVAGAEDVNFEPGVEYALSNRPVYAEELNDGSASMSEIPGMALLAEWWKKASDKGWFGEGWMEKTSESIAGDLGFGYSAMVICDDIWINDHLGGDKEYKSIDFDVMPVFMGEAKGVVLGSPVPMIGVKKDNAMAGVALDFVLMLSDPEVYNVCFSGVYSIPLYNDQTGIIIPEQFGSVDESSIVSLSAFYPRVRDFDKKRGSDSLKAYIRGEISVDECLKGLGNGR